MLNFDAKQSDLSVEVRFAAPAFALLRSKSGRLHDRMYAVLGKYGLTANDIAEDNAPSTIGHKSLAYTANRIATVVKLQISRIEIACWDLKRISMADGSAVFVGIMDALVQTLPGLEFEDYYTTLTLHAQILGQTAAQFINARISGELESLGPSTGHALAYYFGQSGPRRRLVIVLDGSAAYQDSLFLRQSADYDGKALNYRAVPEALLRTVEATLKALDLEENK